VQQCKTLSRVLARTCFGVFSANCIMALMSVV
jgi:hypothetical protein